MNEHLIPWFLATDDPASIYLNGSYVALDFETDSDQNGSAGVELRDVLVFDPMLAQWVLDGNRKGKGYERSLRGMARRYRTKRKLDIVGVLLDLGIPTRSINEHWLLEYCYRDVDAMVEIFEKQKVVISERNVWHLVHTRNLTCPVLADMEFVGLELDKERVNQEYKRVQAKLEELGEQLAEMSGGINLGSPKQLAVYLYDTLKFKEVRDHNNKPIRTAKGAKATAAPVLAKLVAETEEQTRFLSLYKEYNKMASLLEKNLEYFKLVCEHQGGRFFGQIKQNATGTHRLASSGFKTIFPGTKKAKSVQLQNVPREYKSLFFAADEDYEIVSVDSSQVEFRVAVDMGHDVVGYDEVVNGTDIHTFTAKELYDNGDEEMLSIDSPSERRQQAKKSTFRPLYGGGSGSPALQAYCQYFKDKYEGISSMQHGWALKCADAKEYKTPYGMTYYFDAEVSKRGYISYTTSIYNYPVQGFATGEIIPIALVYFWHKTRELRCNIFVTIHDSIDSRVHKDDVEEVLLIAKECLTLDVYRHLERVYKYVMKTPLGLGMKHARHWNEGKEVKWDIFPDGKEIER
jgi:DNA polymerase-1